MGITSLFKNFHYISLVYHTILSMLLFAQYFFRWDFFFSYIFISPWNFWSVFYLCHLLCKNWRSSYFFLREVFPYIYIYISFVFVMLWSLCSLLVSVLKYFKIFISFTSILSNSPYWWPIDWIMTHSYLPKKVHILVPQTWNTLPCMAKEMFKMWFSQGSWHGKDYPGLSGWIHCHHHKDP